ncbi:MAG: acylglycerol kinase family protein, partial [Flavitalea sp.]
MDNLHNVVVFHNPGAGDAAHEKDSLLASLKGAGFKAQYYSTKKDWQLAEVRNADLIVVGGGDGTVRKIAGWLLENDLLKLKIPVTILPLGTANNLSKTLKINGETAELIASWNGWAVQPYDIGHVSMNGTGKIKKKEGKEEQLFFMEAMGSGL